MKKTPFLIALALLLAGCSNLEMKMPPPSDPEVAVAAVTVPNPDIPSACRKVTFSLSQLGRTHSVTVALLVDDGIGVEDPNAAGSFIARDHTGFSLQYAETLPYSSATCMLDGSQVEIDVHYDYFTDLASQSVGSATTTVVLTGPGGSYPVSVAGCAPYSYELGSLPMEADAQSATGALEPATDKFEPMFSSIGIAEVRLRNQSGELYFTWTNPQL